MVTAASPHALLWRSIPGLIASEDDDLLSAGNNIFDPFSHGVLLGRMQLRPHLRQSGQELHSAPVRLARAGSMAAR
jgi:hypothetical protein